jgi:cellulose synthase operon protein C
MNWIRLRCLVFLITLFTFFSFGMAATPDISWPSKEIIGELHDKVTDLHKEQLIKAILDKKYVPGDSSFFDIVYQHEYITVDKDGHQVIYRDSAIRANTPEARQALGEYTARFNAAKESVDFLLAEVYLPNGSKIETDTAQYQIKEPFTKLIYSDLKVKTLSLKGIEEGSILRIVSKQTYKPDVDKGFILIQSFLDYPIPVKEYLLVVHIEQGAKLLKKEKIDHLSPSMVTKIYDNGGESYYTYAISDLKPQVPEPASVPSTEISDNIIFVSPSTWNEVADWWTHLYESKVSTGPAIKEKAIDLTKNLSSKEEKIRALYNYVKTIRYVAIHLNEGAYVPHPAEETLNNKYGDCKDKSVLLLSLLRSIGIDGVIALVRVAGLIDKDLPSAKYFDHAIVAIPASNQNFTFLDATGPSTPYGLLPEGIQYRQALIPNSTGGVLFLIPPQPPDLNLVEETINTEVQDVQTAAITNRFRRYSSNDFYHRLPTIPQPLLIKEAREIMAGIYKDFDVVSVQYDPADEQGILRGENTIKVRDFTKKMGQLYIFNPLFQADRLGDERIVGSSDRNSDIELDGPRKLVVTSNIKLPASVAVEALPKSISIKSDKFGSYSYEVTQSEGMLRIRREVQIAVKRVAAKDYVAFRDFYRACLNQDEELVGLKSR